MGRFEHVRANLRRVAAAGRDSVRAARAEVKAVGKTTGASAEDPLIVTIHSGKAAAPDSPKPREDLDVPRSLRIAASWAWRLLMLAGAAFAVLWMLAKLQLVVVPVAIALLLSALLAPAVGWLRRRHMHRSLATAIVLVGGLVAVGGTLYLVINEFINGLPELSRKSSEGIQKIQDSLHVSDKQLSNFFSSAQDWLQTNRTGLTSGALSTATTIGHVLTGLFLVLFTTFFFLRDGRRISQFLIGMLPEPVRERLGGAADASWQTLVSYVRATVLVAFIDALGIGLALVLLRVEFAFPLAALVFLGAFIPIVGATLSGAVAVLVALVTQGPVIALLALASVIAVQQLEGHVLQPLIMGKAVAIHPLAVILAIATGAVVAGIVGALVAVPIVAVLNTGVRHLVTLHRAQEAGVSPEPTPPTGPPEPGGRFDT